MKRSPLTIAVAAALILIFGLMLFVFQVRKSQAAVVTLFGRVARVQTEPGPGLRLPWPIEKVYILDTRIQNFEDEDKLEEVKLGDENIVLLRTYVGWKIEDAGTFYTKFRDGSIPLAEGTLLSLVRSAKASVAGKHSFSDFISADQKQMKFAQVEHEISDLVQAKVQDSHYGLGIKFVQFKQIELPQTVTADVYGRMQSEREKFIKKIEAEGQEEAAIITSAADRDAAKVLSDAEAKAKEIRGTGQAEMIASLRVMDQNPELASFIMKLSAFEELFKQNSSFILDQGFAPLDLIKTVKSNSQTNGTSQPAEKGALTSHSNAVSQ